METTQVPTYCETGTALTVKGAPAWLHLYLTSQGKDAVFLPVPQDGLCTNARTRKNRAYLKSPLFILPRGYPTVPSDQDSGYTFPNQGQQSWLPWGLHFQPVMLLDSVLWAVLCLVFYVSSHETWVFSSADLILMDFTTKYVLKYRLHTHQGGWLARMVLKNVLSWINALLKIGHGAPVENTCCSEPHTGF